MHGFVYAELLLILHSHRYLNPQGASVNSTATALAAVNLQSASVLTAVVPSGLPAGLYDAVAVNPDGAFLVYVCVYACVCVRVGVCACACARM